MTPANPQRPVSVVPDMAAIAALTVLCWTPLLLSSGLEPLDGLFYKMGGDLSLLSLEPLVGMDVWLHWIARLLIIAGLTNVAVRRARPFWSFRRRMTTRAARLPEPGTDLYRLGVRHGRLSSIRVLPAGHGPVAFTAGLVRPRIYVSASVLAALDSDELELLLLHEIKHCRSGDPLRSLFATILGDLFFWLPAVRTLEERVMSKIEFDADDAAAQMDRAGLARTILKVAQLGVAPTACGVVPFTSCSSLHRRVRRLLCDEDESTVSTSDHRAIRATVLLLIALWTLGFTTYGTHNAHQEGGSEGSVAQLSSPG
ncbi:MAG: hypothetical protein BMS9Abin29_1371 [Gemmatimonadota bacterium]|nr:MAG: hypothetical protein BMS9Abin29_1371 [Gemmatimonadota bacterium]